MPKKWLYLWLSLSLGSLAPVALAYLDPASGSMLLQVLLGGIAGLTLVVKLYWHKLLGMFGLSKKEENQEESEALKDDDTEA